MNWNSTTGPPLELAVRPFLVPSWTCLGHCETPEKILYIYIYIERNGFWVLWEFKSCHTYKTFTFSGSPCENNCPELVTSGVLEGTKTDSGLVANHHQAFRRSCFGWAPKNWANGSLGLFGGISLRISTLKVNLIKVAVKCQSSFEALSAARPG